MTIVLDANVLLRLTDQTSPQHAVADAAVRALRAQGHVLRTVPQSVYEFWVVATRPKANNGLGLSAAQCGVQVAAYLTTYPVLADPAGLVDEWRRLVAAHRCLGKVAHDARYAAALRLHGLTHLLTFNAADFARFAPGLTAVDPAAP